MTFVDTNILIDIFDRDPVWSGWSRTRLEEQALAADLTVNSIVFAELSPARGSVASLVDLLTAISVRIAPIDEETAFHAGRVHARYRRDRPGRVTGRVLPDFLIGAHAFVLGLPLLTRDPTLYRRYFPELTLITPETRHD